ncbi:hypothetical protein LSH36_161g12021 [Paralvinella palmiformis]|uniref:Dephospho-CoA kinase domain-containing protein n=1 Tax=Paralvinella palmiformis TaxID=53620 RepID=A0AAD9JTQ3_9ANNE|nr:hypothetical protein LSH36_161g12021 [Paralvinella palmiformis]
MFLVGLTGGIATGKSTVATIFRDLRCPLIDADVEAREVVLPGKPAWRKIKQLFGDEFLLPDGTLDREKLGRVIFSDPYKRKLLNSITHPEIQKAIMWKLLTFFVKGCSYVILDLPLLFESGSLVKYMTRVIVVTCDEDLQLQRLTARDRLTNDEALQRIRAQLPLAEKCKQASHVIINNGTQEETRNQVNTIYHSLYHSKSHWKLRIILFGMTTLLFVGVIFIFQFATIFY